MPTRQSLLDTITKLWVLLFAIASVIVGGATWATQQSMKITEQTKALEKIDLDGPKYVHEKVEPDLRRMDRNIIRLGSKLGVPMEGPN